MERAELGPNSASWAAGHTAAIRGCSTVCPFLSCFIPCWPIHHHHHHHPLQSPYHTNLLMAGFDEGSGPALYWCDYLATLHQMNICGTGYGAWASSRWWLCRQCWLGAIWAGALGCCQVAGNDCRAEHRPPVPLLPLPPQALTLCCPCLISCGTQL